MKCLILCYTFVLILVLVKSATKYCLFEESKGNEAHCGIHDTDSVFDSIPYILRDITYIDLWGQPLKQLQSNAFRVLHSQRNITTVTLQFCQIVRIDVNAFMNLNNLELLDLSFNSITHVAVGTFHNVPTVNYIFLEHNQISVLHRGLLENLTSLIRVHFDYNRIAHIEENAFKNTPKLYYIDLSNNKLQTLNMSFKDNLDNRTFLYLHDNPWTCNDDLTEIQDYIVKYNNTYQYDIKRMPRCENPLEIRGIKWNETSLVGNQLDYSNTALELQDYREESPSNSLLALLVGHISTISLITLHIIFIAILVYLYRIRRSLYNMARIPSHDVFNIENEVN